MYNLSIDRDSLNPETWKNVGENYHLMNKDTAAINCYWKALGLDSSDAFTYNLNGNSYFNLSRYDDALWLYDKAIKLRPDIALFYFNYGFVSLSKKDSVAAEKYYKLALEKRPDYRDVYYELAKLKAMQLKTKEALTALAQAFKYGNYSRDYVEKDNAFISLRKNKAFLEMVGKLNK
jgi:tetratricopeptide (TPR) repeat protein